MAAAAAVMMMMIMMTTMTMDGVKNLKNISQ
jgi:hypothetical protein